VIDCAVLHIMVAGNLDDPRMAMANVAAGVILSEC
jgi:hypothetical protein